MHSSKIVLVISVATLIDNFFLFHQLYEDDTINYIFYSLLITSLVYICMSRRWILMQSWREQRRENRKSLVVQERSFSHNSRLENTHFKHSTCIYQSDLIFIKGPYPRRWLRVVVGKGDREWRFCLTSWTSVMICSVHLCVQRRENSWVTIMLMVH